jgi:hypothetical protein
MKSHVLFTLFYTSVSFGQAKVDYSAIDSPISKIHTVLLYNSYIQTIIFSLNVSLQKRAIRVVFYWTTANISYDLANKASQQEQSLEDRIAKPKINEKEFVKTTLRYLMILLIN